MGDGAAVVVVVARRSGRGYFAGVQQTYFT